MKKGFTMIELVFVIVILGILASIAVPKLAATRDDTEVTKAVVEMKDAITQLTAYYTVNGKFLTVANGDTGGAQMDIMSPLIKEIKNRPAGKRWVDCVNMKVSNAEGLIKIVELNTPNNSPFCKALKETQALKDWTKQTQDNGGIKVGGYSLFQENSDN
ncbi:putative type II secretion system protein [Campylobacter iguaniorum]|uniref:type II secretion system protein n=1 Tax=Campylobacter iguaniorum TaxID=1244531 RepID=UPI00073A28B8|nr:type II secretion system protein [Campylobacter iguaniorum]ALV24625.1 putative type II secretion system protein [Campylobacter iguaniorum]